MFNGHVIHSQFCPDAIQNVLLLFRGEGGALKDHGHVVNTCGAMLEQQGLFFKNLKQATTKAQLPVHHVLAQVYGAESRCTGNTGDLAMLIFSFRHNQGAGGLGPVRVLDTDGHVGLHSRDDRLIMKHTKPGIGQFSHLTVGEQRKGRRILFDARVHGKHRIHVREILVYVRLHSCSQDGAGNIRATSRKRRHFTLLSISEKTGKHSNIGRVLQCSQMIK